MMKIWKTGTDPVGATAATGPAEVGTADPWLTVDATAVVAETDPVGAVAHAAAATAVDAGTDPVVGAAVAACEVSGVSGSAQWTSS